MSDTNFFCNIDKKLRAHPEEICIIWPKSDDVAGKVTYTGKDILNQVTNIRLLLADQGVKKEDKVLLAIPVSVETASALLAVMAMGAIPVLPPAGVKTAHLYKLIRRHKIKAILWSGNNKTFIPQLLARIVGLKIIGISARKLSGDVNWCPPQMVPAEQPALISHSSGSTGTAKPIVRTHRVLQAQHEILKKIFPPEPGQRDFPLFPNILLHNLSAGVLSILPDISWHKTRQINPERVVQQLLQEQVQTLTGNVFYFTRLLAYLQQNPVTFKQVTALGIGGSPVPEKLATALKVYFPEATIYIIYGSSEAEPIAVRPLHPGQTDPRHGYLVGAPVAGLNIRIQPISTIKLPDATMFGVGEIEVSGEHVATGPEINWLKTGDFGYINQEKQLVLTGRKQNEKVHQGIQHYQLEHVLQQLPGVEQVAAQAADAGFNIYITGSAPATIIKEAMRLNFPEGIYKKIIFQESLPLDSRHHSKILYQELN